MGMMVKFILWFSTSLYIYAYIHNSYIYKFRFIYIYECMNIYSNQSYYIGVKGQALHTASIALIPDTP